MIRAFASVIIAALVPSALGAFGIWKQLGAHPWWDVQTALIGAGLGCFLALVFWKGAAKLRWGAAALILGISTAAAFYGKRQFAASFAEDALAGQFWYFGWIGVSAGLAMFVAQITRHLCARL